MRDCTLGEVATKRKCRSVSSFLKKTYEILEDHHNSHAIRWAPTGIGFIVVKQEDFSKDILPQYFKHSNYSSFVRQLNMYNFHKIREANCESHFHHDFFRRNSKELLGEIKRKPEKKKRKNDDESDDDRRDPDEHSQNRSEISMKQSLLPKQQQEPSEQRIRSYKETPYKSQKITHHNFTSEKENHIFIDIENPDPNKARETNKVENQESKERVSIQNILANGEVDQDKLSINNQIGEFPRYPTKQIFCPSSNNIYPFPVCFKTGVISQFNILF